MNFCTDELNSMITAHQFIFEMGHLMTKSVYVLTLSLLTATFVVVNSLDPDQDRQSGFKAFEILKMFLKYFIFKVDFFFFKSKDVNESIKNYPAYKKSRKQQRF